MPSIDCFCCGPTPAGVTVAAVLSLLGGINDIVFGVFVLPNYIDGHWLFAVSVVQGGLTSVASCALMAGVWQKKATLLLPYSTVMMLGVVTYFIIGTAVLVIFDEQVLLDYGLWYYCWAAVVGYFLNVVRLFRIKILESELQLQQLRDNAFRANAIRGNSEAARRPNSRASVSTIFTTQPRRSVIASPSSSNDPTLGIRPMPGSYPQSETSSGINPTLGSYPQSGSCLQPGPSSAPTPPDNFQEIGWNRNEFPNEPPPAYSVTAPSSYSVPPPPYPSSVLPPFPGKETDTILHSSKQGLSDPSAPTLGS